MVCFYRFQPQTAILEEVLDKWLLGRGLQLEALKLRFIVIRALPGIIAAKPNSPLQRYTRSDQMIISCEKQNTPSLPPLSVESKMFPELDVNKDNELLD